MTSEQSVKKVHPRSYAEAGETKFSRRMYRIWSEPHGVIIGRASHERSAWAAALKQLKESGDY